ncbi:MAG TPA: TolC family protein [Chitinophagales bacterium]|nr:TolC family protein [Chitinophagales bacterium]
MIKKIFSAAILTGAILFAGAQTVPAPAQLTELISKAMENYPKLKEANEYVGLSEARRDLAYGAYMPVISGDASYRYGKPTPSITFPVSATETKVIQFIPENNFDLGLKVQQPIWDFGRTGATVKKAKSEIATSKDNLESAKNTLAYQVAQVYFGIVFLNKSIDVQNGQISLLEANEKLIGDKIKNGDALKFDLLSTQVKKNSSLNRLIDLQTQLKKQYDLLNMVTGNTGYDYITAKDADGALFKADAVNADNNPDIKVLNDKLETANWDIKIAKRGWLPSLVANASAGYRNGFVPDINKLMFNYNAGVGLNIPIFSSARPNYQTKIAKINLQANTYALEAQKLNLNKDIAQAKNDVAATENKLKNYGLQVEQANEAVSLANTRYRGGVITNLELLTAQTNFQDAQLGKIQLEYNLLLSKLELNRIGGTKFW